MRYKHRVISGLTSASLGDRNLPPKKVKGLKASGLAYERKVNKILRENYSAITSQWIHFSDINGYGYAQPDAFIEKDTFVLCIEIKLKENSVGYLQMFQLYRPLLEHIYKKPVYCLQICKNYGSDDSEVCSIEKMLKAPKLGNYCYSL